MGCFDTSSIPEKIPTQRIPYDTGVAGLPDAESTKIVDVKNGDTLRLNVEYVAKMISGKRVRMLAYNRSIPGPTIRTSQGSEIVLLVTNKTPLPTSLHSHGVRLDYRYDGIPNSLYLPIDSGKTEAYHIRFPDPGIFWYHPHTREDYQMELGLYGNYLISPSDSTYWPPVHREITLMLDDILLNGNVIQPFYKDRTDYALMGRYGNVFLVNGDTAFTLRVQRNEVIRFYATNASNSRVYNLKFSRDMDLNILGADNGRYEYPSARENEIIAPSERLIFQVWFNDGLDDYDTLELWNVTPQRIHVLGRIIYAKDSVANDLRSSITLIRSSQVAASLDPFRPFLNKWPDQEVLLTGYMEDRVSIQGQSALPKHDSDIINSMGIEWYDDMGLMNGQSHTGNTKWIMRDLKTSKENHDIHWIFKRNDKVLIRFMNDSTKKDALHPNRMMHPMPHPIHFHGQRFLVVRENGKMPSGGLVWRDSYLIGRGFTVDVLLDASNPGDWMFHCHIAEHIETGMMAHFSIVDSIRNEKIPYPWWLNLHFESDYDSIRGDALLAVDAQGTVSGKLTPYDPLILKNILHFQNVENPQLKVNTLLQSDGRFQFNPFDLLGTAFGRIHLRIYPEILDTQFRLIPDTLRLTLDRRIAYSWSLDLNLAGDTLTTGLKGNVNVTSRMLGMVSGQVNGYDPTLFVDTLFFRNLQYSDLKANVPLEPNGSFAVNAFDWVAELDGTHTLFIIPKFKVANRRPNPDTLKIILNRL